MRPYTSKEAVAALKTLSDQISAIKGRAWLSLKTAETKISFPATIVIDRKTPRLRIEAMDPFGSTHALLLLRPSAKSAGLDFTMVDFDHHEIYEARDSWYGLPLNQFPNLLLGLASFPDNGAVGAAGPDGFEIRSGKNTFRYAMTWIDPGPRLALESIEGEVLRSRGAERYVVLYSKYLDKKDFYLPEVAEVKGYAVGASAQEPRVEVKITWRERDWNGEVSDKAFVFPEEALKGFSRE